ncbi:MAG: NAD(P)/FAD-dependent oxidoreductase [Thermoproteota archaeon]
MKRITIVGAGPSGAALAYFLAQEGFDVTVYDGAPPGFKACGWAVPKEVERYLKISDEHVLTKIKRFRVYLDGELAKEGYESTWGYIIDKPSFLKSLLEQSDFRRMFVTLAKVFEESRPEKEEIQTVIATGSYTPPPYRAQRDYITAVQKILKVKERVDTDTVEFWFDSNMVGYYWVFPRDERVVDVGVGGYEPPQRLLTRLETFTRLRFPDHEAKSHAKGAPINVGGAEPDALMQNPPVIGEAAGFVFPLTGEGIRPSIATAFALKERIVRGADPRKEVAEVAWWINTQRRILNVVRRSSPESRARLLQSIPLDLFVKLGLGTLRARELLIALPTFLKISPTLVQLLREAGAGETRGR